MRSFQKERSLSMMSLKSLAKKIAAVYHGEDRPLPKLSLDSRTIQPGELYVAIRGERLDGHRFVKEAIQKGASAIMVESPMGENVPEIVVPNTVEALGKMARVWREQFSLPLIAVTGSCGKTGTKEMIAAILSERGLTLCTKGNFNNHLGMPLTLLSLTDEHRFAVLELGASHPGEIRYLVELAKPTVGLITNIHASHLEGFGSLESISKEKSEIYRGLPSDGIAVVNVDEPFAKTWSSFLETRHQITYGLNHPADISASHVAYTDSGVRFEIHTPIGKEDCYVPLLGDHVVQNALAAAAASMAVGADLDSVVTGLARVIPVKGRMVPCVLEKGAALIDDTYNASALSVESAIRYLSKLPGKKIFVMSNMAEMGPDSELYHRKMGEWIRGSNIDQVFLTGRKEYLIPTLQVLGNRARFFETQQQLIEALQPCLGPEVTVLVKGCRSSKMEIIVQALKGETCSKGLLCH